MSNKLECMRYAGKVNQQAIGWGFSKAIPGVSLREIDEQIEWYIRQAGCTPAFKNYQPEGYALPFKHSACISVNHGVVHGVPNDYKLQNGDLLTIDLGTKYNDWFVDAARSRVIGVNEKAQRLVDATESILHTQLSVVKDQCDFLTMVKVTEEKAKTWKVNICPLFGGHGINTKIHDAPFIPSTINRSKSKIQQQLEERQYARQYFIAGQTYCIEPVIMLKDTEIYIDDDGWTVYTKDGGLACHSERCIFVTQNGFEILS